ncbi:fluoroquinolone export ABC transporter permease subunit [Glycomyces tritici]|uniref:Fluoroquinolone transporter permease n=1 Tax=Glycomyces tritici TaxID=2665176 RepID=A0ABT7YTZ9_9ACTN|nr:fluoroquinolone transporter permease [Glycomyces tritici]MDN3241407.1 fluoroquinolone transporter permease [Glycomyces tritici]MDN3242109.1 fluoroquinolone transporter permease [Glycomyces tritici]
MTGVLTQALRLEVRLQWRYGFLYAAAFSALLWEVVVYLIPGQLKAASMTYIIFGDLALVGFFFIAGAVFFERGERTLFALLVSPLRFRAYYTAKLTALAALSLLLSLIIAFSGVGLDFEPFSFTAGVVLCALLFLTCSFISATPFTSISEWIIPSTLVLAVLNVPLINYSGLWEHPITYLIPTQGVLLLMGHSFGRVDLAAWQWLYALAYPVAVLAALGLLSRKMFDRHIAASEGGE